MLEPQHKGDTKPDDRREMAIFSLHENPDKLEHAHLDEMLQYIPQIEIISQISSLSRCNPSSSSLEDSSK